MLRRINTCYQVQWHQLTLAMRMQRPRSNSSSLWTGTANSSSTRLSTHKKQSRSSSWGSIRKWCRGWQDTSSHRCCCGRYAKCQRKSLRFHGQPWATKKRGHQLMSLSHQIVKFDTDALPPILNALETENGGQKLILEVAVR